MSITILLADDHKLMREGLRTLIEEHTGMTVVAESEDGQSAVRLAAELSPEIIIMDISMPGLSGIEATRRLSAAKTASKIIALSMHLDRRMVLEMLAAGASGYLLKDCAFDEVIQAIRTVASNDRYVNASITSLVVRDYADRESGDGPASQLCVTERERQILDYMNDGRKEEEIASLLGVNSTVLQSHLRDIVFNHIVPHVRQRNDHQSCNISLTAREKEILIWIKEGKSSWEISLILGVSPDTVKYHLKNVFQKLNAISRSQAVALAIENKLISS